MAAKGKSKNNSAATDEKKSPFSPTQIKNFVGEVKIEFLKIVWPDKIPGGIVCSDLASTLDLLPTLASITGSEIPEGLLLDGTDISETLFYPDSIRIANRPFFYYGRDGDLEAVRKDNWKLHISKRGVKDFLPALYNLDDDISEQNNQADRYPDIVDYLHSMIIEFK